MLFELSPVLRNKVENGIITCVRDHYGLWIVCNMDHGLCCSNDVQYYGLFAKWIMDCASVTDWHEDFLEVCSYFVCLLLSYLCC